MKTVSTFYKHAFSKQFNQTVSIIKSFVENSVRYYECMVSNQGYPMIVNIPQNELKRFEYDRVESWDNVRWKKD